MLYVGLASRNEVLEWIGIPKVRDWRGPRMSHEGYRVCEPRGVDRSKGAHWKQERRAESGRIEPNVRSPWSKIRRRRCCLDRERQEAEVDRRTGYEPRCQAPPLYDECASQRDRPDGAQHMRVRKQTQQQPRDDILLWAVLLEGDKGKADECEQSIIAADDKIFPKQEIAERQ